MDAASASAQARRRATVFYLALSWIPLSLLITVVASPDLDLHRYERLIQAVLLAFPLMGGALLIWNLWSSGRSLALIVLTALAIALDALVLAWFAASTNYLHSLGFHLGS